MPAHRKLTISDFELLLALEQGQSTHEIARAHGVRPQTVQWRLRQLRANMPAPAARRAEETVDKTLDAIRELLTNVATLHQLKAACERLLESEDGDGLDVGPHDYDMQVLVGRKGGPPIRRRLDELLGERVPTGAGSERVARIEGSFVDPRTLLLQTIGHIRQHIELAVRLGERLHDVEQVERFQQAVLAAIDEADPATAAKVRGALHEQRRLRLALEPPRTGE